MKVRPVGADSFPCGRTDGHEEANSRFFRNFAKPSIKIWRMRIACWIPKSSITQSKYLILLSHGSSGYATDPPCYVTRTLSVLTLANDQLDA